MPGKSTFLSLLYCAKTSNARIQCRHSKVDSANTFVGLLCANVPFFHCVKHPHVLKVLLSVCIVRRYPMSWQSTLLSPLLIRSHVKKFTLLSLLYIVKTSNVRKVYIVITSAFCEDIQCQESLHCYHFRILRRHPMSGKSTLLSLLYFTKTSNVRKVYIHCYHFYILRRHLMSGNSTLLSLLYFAKTSNVRKLHIAITFVFYEDIQCQESLHCYHFCISRRHPMSGKSTLLSRLYFAKTSNVRKVYMAIAKTSNVRKVYIAITFVFCEDIQCLESLHCYHFWILRRHNSPVHGLYKMDYI